jgi:hypothetical protein
VLEAGQVEATGQNEDEATDGKNEGEATTGGRTNGFVLRFLVGRTAVKALIGPERSSEWAGHF